DHDEVHELPELVAEPHHVAGADGRLVARLGGGDQIQLFLEPLILDHRLAQPGAPFDDVHEVVDDAVLQTHDDVEVEQADVRIHAYYFVAETCQLDAHVCRGRRLTDASLA